MNWRSSNNNNWGNVPQTKTLERRVCSSHISKTKRDQKKDALPPRKKSFKKTFTFSPRQKKSNSLERLRLGHKLTSLTLQSFGVLSTSRARLHRWPDTAHNANGTWRLFRLSAPWILDQQQLTPGVCLIFARFCRSLCEDVALSYFWPQSKAMAGQIFEKYSYWWISTAEDAQVYQCSILTFLGIRIYQNKFTCRFYQTIYPSVRPAIIHHSSMNPVYMYTVYATTYKMRVTNMFEENLLKPPKTGVPPVTDKTPFTNLVPVDVRGVFCIPDLQTFHRANMSKALHFKNSMILIGGTKISAWAGNGA